MHRQLAIVTITFTLAMTGVDMAAQTRGPERPADAAAIRAHIESIFQAFVDKDRAKLEATHSSEWRGFTPWSGHVIRGRDGYMNEATFPPGIPKGQGMVGYRIGEFDIVFYGDTAVVTFMAEVDRLEGTNKSTQKLTFIDVYHKDPGGWIQVASNTSLHPDAVFEMMSQRRMLGADERASLMKARESVWRAWFGGDQAALTKLLPVGVDHHRRCLDDVRHAEIQPRRIARLRGLWRKARAARLSNHRDPSLRQHRNPLHIVRDGSAGRRTDTHRARDGDRGVRAEGWCVDQHRLAAGAIEITQGRVAAMSARQGKTGTAIASGSCTWRHRLGFRSATREAIRGTILPDGSI